MDAGEIQRWSDQYDKVYDDDLREIEDHLNDALPIQGHITRDQLEDVVRWKLNGQKGRRDLNIEKVNSVPDEFVQRVSDAAFLVDDPTLQLKTLQSIPGIGGATATVILRFYDPENYAIGDRYIIHEFFGEDRGMRVTDYPKILTELRDRNPGDFNLRTVEKAYYQRYRDEHEVGDW